MQVNINPSKLKGKIMAPPSKSMAHRLLICAGLSNGESTVSGISFSKDITATLNCLKALGASYKTENDKIIIKGVNPATYSGKEILNCNECGSTLRFMIPICMTGGSEVKLTGCRNARKYHCHLLQFAGRLPQLRCRSAVVTCDHAAVTAIIHRLCLFRLGKSRALQCLFYQHIRILVQVFG